MCGASRSVEDLCTLSIKLVSCYQLKRDCYNYKIYYESLIVITKQNPIIDTQMIKRKIQSIPLQNHQLTKKDNKRGRKELQNNQKVFSKISIVNPYLSVIILNVNG